MNLDDKIWNDEKNYFIEDADWQDGATTKLVPGTELIRYSDTTGQTIATYFASKTGKWIKY